MPTGPEIERALVAVRWRRGVVLCASGKFIEAIVEATSPTSEDIGLTNGQSPADGIWIWEGYPIWHEKAQDTEQNLGHLSYEHGSWRQPNQEEWAQIVAGQTSTLWPTQDPLKK